MDFLDIIELDGDLQLTEVKNFSLSETLDCGQCFRWKAVPSEEGICYTGVAFGMQKTLLMQGDTLTLCKTTKSEFDLVWKSYFDLDRDYHALKSLLKTDHTMQQAIAFCPGMRVLQQSPWEMLCTFIISQNNNIPRIRGIVERLCSTFGGQLAEDVFDFPSAAQLANLTLDEFSPIRAGFRAKYLFDAAQKVASGELELSPLYTLPLDEARAELKRIHGVGPKVAECVLLYGFVRRECMPVDVWIARVLETYYPAGFPAEFADVAGIAQQYLFHYIRHLGK